MNRKELIDFCNNEVFTKVNFPEAFYMNCKEVLKMVQAWRCENSFPAVMIPTVTNNYLYINDKPVGRIAPAPAKARFSERADYYEGRILARQERED